LDWKQKGAKLFFSRDISINAEVDE